MTKPKAKTRASLLGHLEARLRALGVPSPAAEARVFARAALEETPEAFFARLAEPVPEAARGRIEAWLARRERGEPPALILGEAEFMGLPLKVRPGVFLPRPETERLVELALNAIEGKPSPRVLDVGTGSGAIALAIKKARPDARVFASDMSEKALELARENARALGLPVEFLKAPLIAGLSGLDLVVANPPYLPERYRETAPRELSFEPEEALYAGPDGLAVARPLLLEARRALVPGGKVVLELDPTNAALLGRFALELGFREVCTLPDLARRPRYLLARAPAAELAGELGLA